MAWPKCTLGSFSHGSRPSPRCLASEEIPGGCIPVRGYTGEYHPEPGMGSRSTTAAFVCLVAWRILMWTRVQESRTRPLMAGCGRTWIIVVFAESLWGTRTTRRRGESSLVTQAPSSKQPLGPSTSRSFTLWLSFNDLNSKGYVIDPGSRTCIRRDRPPVGQP